MNKLIRFITVSSFIFSTSFANLVNPIEATFAGYHSVKTTGEFLELLKSDLNEADYSFLSAKIKSIKHETLPEMKKIKDYLVIIHDKQQVKLEWINKTQQVAVSYKTKQIILSKGNVQNNYSEIEKLLNVKSVSKWNLLFPEAEAVTGLFLLVAVSSLAIIGLESTYLSNLFSKDRLYNNYKESIPKGGIVTKINCVIDRIQSFKVNIDLEQNGKETNLLYADEKEYYSEQESGHKGTITMTREDINQSVVYNYNLSKDNIAKINLDNDSNQKYDDEKAIQYKELTKNAILCCRNQACKKQLEQDQKEISTNSSKENTVK